MATVSDFIKLSPHIRSIVCPTCPGPSHNQPPQELVKCALHALNLRRSALLPRLQRLGQETRPQKPLKAVKAWVLFDPIMPPSQLPTPHPPKPPKYDQKQHFQEL